MPYIIFAKNNQNGTQLVKCANTYKTKVIISWSITIIHKGTYLYIKYII
jgi:hypothetical protein